MSALPVVKLFALFVRTLAKPVANKMKKEASNHKNFSKLCVYCGQQLHYFSSRANVISMGYKFVGVQPLPEEEALAKGANFMSEAFIFTVAGLVITLEVWRSEHQSAEKSAAAKAKEAEKDRLIDQRFQDILDIVEDVKESLPSQSRRKYERLKRIRDGEDVCLNDSDDLIDVATQHPESSGPNDSSSGTSFLFSWFRS